MKQTLIAFVTGIGIGILVMALGFVQVPDTATTTLDTTTNQSCDMTATWGLASASNTLTSTNVILEWLD